MVDDQKDQLKKTYEISTKNKVWPWLVVVGYGFLNALTMQLIVSNSGIFLRPIVSEFGFSNGNFMLWVTFMILSMSVALPIMGRLLPKYDTRIVLTVPLVICLAAWASNSLFTQMWQWWVAAIVIGLSGAFVFAQTMPIVTGNWFAKNKGFAIGATYMISAGIAAVLAIAVAASIQAYGWRVTYVLFAVVSLCLCLPWTLFVIRFKPEDLNMVPYGYDPNGPGTDVGGADTPGVNSKKAMLTTAFWLIFIAGGLVTLFGGFTKQIANAAITWGYDAMFGATLTSIIALYRFASPIAGIVADKLGAIRGACIWISVVILGFLGYIFFNSNPSIVILATVFLAFQSSLQNTFIPMITRQVFGSKDYSKIFSSMAIGFSVIGAFGTPIVGWFYDAAGGVYTNAFWFGIGIAVIAICVIVASYYSSKKVIWDD